MVKPNALEKFMEQVKPRPMGRPSKLEPHLEEIRKLKSAGYSDTLVVVYLHQTYDLSVERATVSAFIKRKGLR